jgi:hypothetical protein
VAKYAVQATAYVAQDKAMELQLPQKYTVWASTLPNSASKQLLRRSVSCPEHYDTPLPVCRLDDVTPSAERTRLTGTTDMVTIDAPEEEVERGVQAIRWAAREVLMSSAEKDTALAKCGRTQQPSPVEPGLHQAHLAPGCALHMAAGHLVKAAQGWWLPSIPKPWLLSELPELLLFANGQHAKQHDAVLHSHLWIEIAVVGTFIGLAAVALLFLYLTDRRETNLQQSGARPRRGRRFYFRTSAL